MPAVSIPFALLSNNNGKPGTGIGCGNKYRLTWTDDPTTTMTIGWCQVSGTPVGVEYDTDPSFSGSSTETAITIRSYDNTARPGEGEAFDNSS